MLVRARENEIRHAKRERRKAERRWRLSKLDSDLVAFKIKRNAVNNLMKNTRQAFYTNFMGPLQLAVTWYKIHHAGEQATHCLNKVALSCMSQWSACSPAWRILYHVTASCKGPIEENSSDQRTLFRASKRLFKQSQDDGLPPNLHDPTFANQIGEYFVTKIDTIQRQIEADITDLTVHEASISVDSTAKVFPTLSAFKTLSDKNVKLLIQNSALKSCPLDPMPSR